MVIMEENDDYYSNPESSASETEEVQGKRKQKTATNKANKKQKGNDNDVLPKLNKSNKNHNDLYRQPTVEELTHLRETESLFNSNIFRLQIDELLSEINVKEKLKNQYNNWFEKFEASVEGLKEYGEIQLSDFKDYDGKKLNKEQKFLKSAFGNVGESIFVENSDISMKFNRPKSVFNIRDHLNISNTNSKFNGNICVTIQKNSFYEKDYLNMKYFIKKYYYIIYLLTQFKQFDFIKNIEVENYLGNEWLTVLKIVPDYSDKVVIRIFVVPETDTFKPVRFLPDKNNVKQTLKSLTKFKNFDIENFNSKGTFWYNSLLLHDINLETNHELIKTTIAELKNVQDGIKLLMVWLTQRNVNSHYTGFTNDLMLHIIAFLYKKKRINMHMSSYQVVRIFWSFLNNLNDGETLSFSDEVKPNTLKSFSEAFVLLDASGHCNLAAFLNREVYRKVKREAGLALNSLDSNKFNTFAALFTTNIPFGIQYDAVVKIKSKCFKKIYKLCSDDDKFYYYGHYRDLIANYVTKTLKKGLGRRIVEIVTCSSNDGLTIGINLNLEHYSEVIEKGPQQFDADARDFLEFWGPLAELRRFKDSTVCEAVYFKNAITIQDKRLIFKDIIDYVLKQKLQVEYDLNACEMESLLKSEHVAAPFPTGSNEEATLKVKSIHYELSKILRGLTLPLDITAIQGISEVFSYTDVFPPVACNHHWGRNNAKPHETCLILENNPQLEAIPFLVEPIENVIQLAIHSKWPKDLAALRAMKVIFNNEIAKQLKDHNIKTIVRNDCLDVFYEGLVFRFALYHPKEVALLKKDVDKDGVTFYKDTDESLALERRMEILPKISGALNGIQQENPCFGPTVCLIKRWMRSQLLDHSHISDTAVNLLTAALFLSPEPFDKPTLPQIGFLRFLKFLSEFDFKLQPVVVNFNSEMTSEALNEIETRFLQNRHDYNALCILTPYDDGKSVFTREAPDEHVLRRIKALAAGTCKHLLACLQAEGTLKYKNFFIPNLEGYNAIIKLKAPLNPRRNQQIDSDGIKAIQLQEFSEKLNTKFPVVGFDPVQFYLNELRSNYGHCALFFHDYYGGDTIGVLWKQKSLEPQDFKITSVNSKKRSSDKLVLNVSAILEDFFNLGSGLVESIDVSH